ncbi:sensor histidine kinase [Acrocarpospora macrocephala]|uniref:histidine kinase n=1 Tax=Acrocarpospora macrocephala TaxID=150177 RepID=A0A5M3X5C8_9ACTN|nr:histidine kinase [Acrocarpospora macrocephala]GES16280.1 two-component sensor histidine kinase [Acrocarpospora macrocephala]
MTWGDTRRWASGIGAWFAGRPLVLDALLAALLFLVTLGPGQVVQGGPGIVVLQTALVLPLVWRRRAPLAVFGVIAAAAFVQWLTGVQLPADAALLVALYTLGAHSTWRRMLTAGAVLGIGILMASARWAPEGLFPLTAVASVAMAAAAALMGTAMADRRAYVASLERDRDQRARLAVAEERAHMAREMHDIVTHNLSVMVALADSAIYVLPGSPDRAAAAVEQISGTGRQALAEMRRSLGVLRPGEPGAPRHPMPGVAQLPALVDRMRAAGLPTRLEVAGDPTPVPAAAQLTVYRLAQEALTNALKHTSPGTTAEVRVHISAEAVAVEVTDDGRAARAAVGSPGQGIIGMHERVAVFGGTLRAGPVSVGGWRVSARLDLDPGRAREGAA